MYIYNYLIFTIFFHSMDITEIHSYVGQTTDFFGNETIHQFADDG